MAKVKAPAVPSTKDEDRDPPGGIRHVALAEMAARVAGKEKLDSRARMAVRLDTFSRVMNKSDTTGAVEFCIAVHVLVALVVFKVEEEAARRRRFNPSPSPLERRLEEEEEEVVVGQVEAVFPGSTADTDWLAKSDVRKPDTRTSPITTPWELRAEVMSQRRPW